MKHTVTACMYKIVKGNENTRNTDASKLLGVTTHQISLARETVQDLIDIISITKRLKRKIRKDFIRTKLEPRVYDFINDDTFT